MLLGMGCREVHGEQRIEVFQSFLRHLAAHLLRLVQNEDRSVRLDNVDGSAGTELIPRIIYYELFLIFLFSFGYLRKRARKCLRVDNHHVDAVAGGKIVQLVEVGAVIDEEAGLFSVVLHEVFHGNLKALFHALTNSDRRHDYDKLRPPIPLIQLEHGFDINVGLACTRFHLDIKTAPPQILDKGR